MKESVITNQKLVQNVGFLDKIFFSDFLEVTKELNISEIHLTGGELVCIIKLPIYSENWTKMDLSSKGLLFVVINASLTK